MNKGKCIRLLLIEDDPSFVSLAKRALSKYGHDCTFELVVAYNGKDALDILEATLPLPDVILVDINMPVMNGIEFVRAFQRLGFTKGKPPYICVLSTAIGFLPTDIQELVSCTFDKPLSQEDIQKIVTNCGKR